MVIFLQFPDCIQILGDKSCEVIFPKIARWILRVNGTTFISPSGWLLGAQCTSKNVVDWPLKMTQPFGTRYVYGWNIQIRSVWHCEGEEICIISGFLWGAHWGSQHLGLLHESMVIDWELPCISNLMKVRKTQWLSNKTRGINIPPFGSYLAKLQCSATVDNGRNLYIPCRGADPVSTHAEGTVDSDQMLGLDLWKKNTFFGNKNMKFDNHELYQAGWKTTHFHPKIWTSSSRCLPSYDRRQGIFFLGGMDRWPHGFRSFSSPTSHYHPRPSEGDGYWASPSVRRWVGWNPVEAPKDGGGCGTPLPNGLYKWFINGGWFLKPPTDWDVPPRTLGMLEIFPLEKIYNGGIH